eukprot:TRINITY_DN60669_c0_g1_i1.p1 TRINITY_DN60669_c0_g1~~TRINITY_DN60669_c0_g1_i1.p1  ORF type:complete len:171 (-),score=12.96 TRINITY_DN60669_c0_g1_i1:124-636(-)
MKNARVLLSLDFVGIFGQHNEAQQIVQNHFPQLVDHMKKKGVGISCPSFNHDLENLWAVLKALGLPCLKDPNAHSWSSHHTPPPKPLISLDLAEPPDGATQLADVAELKQLESDQSSSSEHDNELDTSDSMDEEEMLRITEKAVHQAKRECGMFTTSTSKRSKREVIVID